MFCPACGSTVKDEQKYCRSCGMNLQLILPQVTHHLKSTSPNSRLRNIFKTVGYLGLGLGGSGIALMAGTATFALLALSFIGPNAKSMSPMWSQLFGIGLLLLLKGALLFAGTWISKKLFLPKVISMPVMDVAKTKELPIETFAELAPSITEHTTRQLDTLLPKPPKTSV